MRSSAAVPDAGPRPRVPLDRIERIALALGIVLAAGFLLHQWWYPSYLYDAGQYQRMGRNIAEHGLFTQYTASAIRTFGYPVFLGALFRASSISGISFTNLLFMVQLAGYLAACFGFRAALSAWSRNAARLAFSGMVLNFYVLLYAAEPLTESISITLLVLVAACWLRAYQSPHPAWMAVGSLLAGAGMIVRPAHLFVAAAWLLGVALILVRRRFDVRRTLILAAAAVMLTTSPTWPQLAYNVLRFGRWSPLLVESLGTRQQVWGIENIKYATGLPPVSEPRIFYENPFSARTPVDDTAPVNWYLEHPVAGAATLALHVFNLTDQDLLFTYSRDLHPWYRVPLGVLNHALVAMGVLGLIWGWRRGAARGPAHARDAWGMLVVTLAANVAIYLPTAVEMRFGLTILLALGPLAAYAAVGLRGRPTALVVTALLVGGYVAAALTLSGWVRDQAPVIRQAAPVEVNGS